MSDLRTDSPPPTAAVLRAGLERAALVGAAWGAIETLARVLFARFGPVEGRLTIPSFTAADAFFAVALSAFEYALVGLLVGLAGGFLLLGPLELATRRPARGAAGFALAAPLAVGGAAIFVNLFWWSRFASRQLGIEALRFVAGEPFHSPKRMALSLLFALVALGAVLLAGRRAARLARRAPGRGTAALLALVVLAAAVGLWRDRALRRQRAAEAPPDSPNVVLVVVDTLRAHNMHCYGYERPTTPRLDEIAREGVLFERAIAQAPFTWTSFGSIFTGKYPRHHGLVKMDPTLRFDPKKNVTLQMRLDEAGYATGAFMTGMISNASGLLDGFETYFEAMVGRDPVHRASAWSWFRSELVLHALWNKIRQALDPQIVPNTAIAWIRRHAGRPFLAVVHLYSTHTPYDPPDEYDVFSPGYDGPIERFTSDMAKLLESGRVELSERDRRRIVDLYDGGVLFADAMIGRIRDALEELGILEKTILVVTSDHGEELGEHGLWEHDWMFNTNLHVPLVLRLPERRGAGVRVPVPVESIDIVPTVLELAGLPLHEGIDGESLVPWIDGRRPKEDDHAFSENNFYVAVQNREWKLVRNRFGDPDDPPRLYHLASDPWEMREVSAREPEALQEMTQVLDAWDRSFPAVGPSGGVENPEVRLLLEQLGYTGGQRPREGPFVRKRAAEAGDG